MKRKIETRIVIPLAILAAIVLITRGGKKGMALAAVLPVIPP